MVYRRMVTRWVPHPRLGGRGGRTRKEIDDAPILTIAITKSSSCPSPILRQEQSSKIRRRRHGPPAVLSQQEWGTRRSVDENELDWDKFCKTVRQVYGRNFQPGARSEAAAANRAESEAADPDR